MSMFLWEIDIEQIPLGWNDIYEDARENYPNGTKFDKYFVHPIECRTQLIAHFKNYQEKAKETYQSLLKGFDRDILHTLLKYDQILYSVLYEWLGDERDHSEFDPKDIEKNINDHYGYLLSANAERTYMQPYKRLQVIQMNFDTL